MDIEKVSSTVMSLDHIDDIINDSKGKENEITDHDVDRFQILYMREL